MTWHKPSLKLAGLYLAIIMAISLFFSVSVWQLSVQELERGINVPANLVGPDGEPGFLRYRDQLQAVYEARARHIEQQVTMRLVLTNLVILAGGGFLSYYLARRTLQPIEEARDAQSRFTADASHELRTPLAVMQSEIEVALMDHQLTLPRAKKQLRSNLEEIAKLTALSEGLLRLARQEYDNIQRQPVAVEAVVSQAIARVLPLAEAKSIPLSPTVASGLRVCGDEASLVEALVILLDNAVKYSPEKTEVIVAVTVTVAHVTIAVTDQGIGIKAAELPHIFERFYRADSARSKQQTIGYGLGLAIAKSIIEQHGGAIAVESKPGAGATFAIALARYTDT